MTCDCRAKLNARLAPSHVKVATRQTQSGTVKTCIAIRSLDGSRLGRDVPFFHWSHGA